jgi:hypothetical protein
LAKEQIEAFRLLLIRCPDLIERLVQRLAVEQTAVHYHGANLARIADIFERIGVQQHEVGDLAFLNRAPLAIPA